MRVLLMTYYYEPEITPRAFKWASLVGYMADRYGIDFDVVVPAKPGLKRELRPSDRIKIHETRSSLLLNQARMKVAGMPAERKGRAFHRFKALPNAVLKAIYFPDTSLEWVPFAASKGAALLRRHGHDVMVSNALPFTSHMASWLVCGRSNIPLILEYGDPFSFNPFEKISRLHRRWACAFEKKLVASACAVTAPTQAAAEGFAKHCGADPERVHVIPSCYPRFDDGEAGRREMLDPLRFHLVYAGTFYGQGRDPVTFFESILQLKNLRPDLFQRLQVHFFGNLSSLSHVISNYREKIGRQAVVPHPPLPRVEMIAVLKQANLLLNFANASAYQMPSKLIDYLYADKPVLTVVPCNLVYRRYLENEMCCVDSKKDIAGLLAKALEDGFDRLALPKQGPAQFRHEDFAIETLASNYWKLFEACL